MVKNLFIHSAADDQALFGYLDAAASVARLGVTGSIVTTGSHAGGVAAYAVNGASISECFNAADIIAAKWAGGICGFTQSMKVTITNCYNTGAVTASGADGFAGGINACGANNLLGAALTNCYNAGTVTAVETCGSLTAYMSKYVTNSYYLSGTCRNATGTKGTETTDAELKALAPTLGEAFKADTGSINNGYPILVWQGSYALGDVNRDGEINVRDVMLVYAFYRGYADLDAEQQSLADFNQDGEIDVKDCLAIYASYR